jgi:hypothetical protein
MGLTSDRDRCVVASPSRFRRRHLRGGTFDYQVLWQSAAIKIAGTLRAATRELAPSYDEHFANRDVVETLRLAFEAAEG